MSILHHLKIQIVRERENEGLTYVQKHIDLGWEAVSKFSLGNEVYFVDLIWKSEEDPKYPVESQLNKK